MIFEYKKILQKDIPERTVLAGYGTDHVIATHSLAAISRIFAEENTSKPDGFWYSLKWYWIEELFRGYYYWDINYTIDPERVYYVDVQDFVYDIDIDDSMFVGIGDKKGINKILQLKNYGDMIAYYDQYGYDVDGREYINWKKVYADYGGIELSVVQLEKYFDSTKMRWWLGWDIASGCLWNGDLVKSIKWIL